MQPYWSFDRNLWMKGTLGVHSNWACLSSGNDGMVVVRTGRQKLSSG